MMDEKKHLVQVWISDALFKKVKRKGKQQGIDHVAAIVRMLMTQYGDK